MEDHSLVSICIPSYNRPLLLREAIDSCLAQAYENIEVLVGDDSKNDLSTEVVRSFQSKYPGKVRYFRNIPSRGQAGNVNNLFWQAAGRRLILLHDDDLLLPNAIQDLSDVWKDYPLLTAAFGKQHMMKMDGTIVLDKSEESNTYFSRVTENAGLQNVPAIAGIRQMFPNNGYLILTEVARRVGYRSFDQVGEACDFDFGLRVCVESSQIFFLDRYTSVYRFSDDAITKTAITAPFIYRFLHDVPVPESAQHVLREAHRRFAVNAASGYARLGNGREALRVLLSSDYPIKSRLTAKFLLHCALTIGALLAGKYGARLVLCAKEKIVPDGARHELT